MAVESADQSIGDSPACAAGLADCRKLAQSATAARSVTAGCKHAAAITKQYRSEARITLDKKHLTRIPPPDH